jgi:hypothetical protein
LIISLDKKFIFVANPKTASTAIELALKPAADICIQHSACGKHDGLQDIKKNFARLFEDEEFAFESFSVAACFRDPLNLLKSQYLFHLHEEFDGQESSTRNVRFEEFVCRYLSTADLTWEIQPQWKRLVADDHIKLNYLLEYGSLALDFKRFLVEMQFGTDISEILPKANVTRNRCYVAIPDSLFPLLRSGYWGDYKILACDRYGLRSNTAALPECFIQEADEFFQKMICSITGAATVA